MGPTAASLVSAGTAAETPPSFAEVYEAHFDFVWRSARRFGLPDHVVEDVVQNIFVVVHRRLPEFEGESKIRSWLFSITMRVARTERRVLGARHPHTVRGDDSPAADALPDSPERRPDEVASQREAARFLQAFLDSLDDDKRAVFILAELEQMSGPEMSAALGANPSTVYSRLRLARAAFSQAVARHRARETWRSG